jgi:hypothetical protein
MVQPEDGVESRHLDDAHIPQSKDIVKSVMKRFKVSNSATVRLVTDMAEGLIYSE